MRSFKNWLIIAILPLVIAGCASAPAKTNYILSTETTPVANAAHALPSMLVSQVRSLGRLSTEMFYSRTPNEIESFTQNEWAAPPAQLIQAAITQDLDNRGLFKYVVMAPTNISAAYRLDMSILEMRQYFPNETESYITLKLQARLINNHNNQIVKTYTYNEKVPAPTYDAAGGVKAYNSALNSIAERLAQALTRTVR